MKTNNPIKHVRKEVHISEAVNAKLGRIANARGISEQEIMKTAITDWLSTKR